ncbi:glycosyl transferase [Paenibacillus selenitireducens]|uniref:Glycosyl transferase n=1 Tax=Paenibacillus selenitireducens TaxID=1324314 RepID=A0A1T2X636_9BACL|nr:glycoside hydrolase family 99-like domain-containing protein [Paenibacillus selenitireducens]OPA75265.1 glycosyl transferase [Paenibacillus selenitireducens]
MKLIAFLLPQFHRIPENDLWWGDGFTEWTNTQKNKPLYAGHQQPKEPLGNYYYDLTDAAARRWQAKLAKSHGIYGFCYYHYWFKGKRLLEKPFQSVLELGEPDFPFCLSWANEPWTRRWDGGDQYVLMPQDYGDEHDWEVHFNEVLVAFLDYRYIRINNKPVFLIYRPGSIPRCEDMIRFWNELARKNGLEGIYFVRTLGGFAIPNQAGFDASVEYEPHYTFAHSDTTGLWNVIHTREDMHHVLDYDVIWHTILNRSPHRNGEQIIPGAYVNWDNTPRLGSRGQSTIGVSPDKFRRYLTRQMERAIQVYDSEFVFINAWNEWAEGTYLEPDKQNGYRYLESVKRALEDHLADTTLRHSRSEAMFLPSWKYRSNNNELRMK